MRAGGGCMILNRVVREGFVKEVTSKQRNRDLQRERVEPCGDLGEEYSKCGWWAGLY